MKKLTLSLLATCVLASSAVGAQAATLKSYSGYGIRNLTSNSFTERSTGQCPGVHMPSHLVANSYEDTNQIIIDPDKIALGIPCTTTYIEDKGDHKATITITKDPMSGVNAISANDYAEATPYGAEIVDHQ